MSFGLWEETGAETQEEHVNFTQVSGEFVSYCTVCFYNNAGCFHVALKWMSLELSIVIKQYTS